MRLVQVLPRSNEALTDTSEKPGTLFCKPTGLLPVIWQSTSLACTHAGLSRMRLATCTMLFGFFGLIATCGCPERYAGSRVTSITRGCESGGNSSAGAAAFVEGWVTSQIAHGNNAAAAM